MTRRVAAKDSLSLLRGDAASRQLVTPSFTAQWQALHERSEDATVFQSPGFVGCWYEAYGGDWEPLIIIDRAADAGLNGLWTLARHRRSGELAHAGAHQSEYQLPLARGVMLAGFVSRAWRRLSTELGIGSLRLRYLPNAELLATLRSDSWLAPRIHGRVSARPLMQLDANELHQAMESKRRKTRFNRLKRLGHYEFRRVIDMVELDRIIGTLIGFYDIRQGAINQSTPFHDDPAKLRFHRALFERGAPNAYVTVSYLDGQPIAAFWGVLSGRTAHLCMVVHSPMLAEHSLGKVHLLQLGRQLLEDGVEVLDLTPGGDRWKEDFANAHDEVLELELYAGPLQLRRRAMHDAVVAGLRATVLSLGLEPVRLRALSKRLRRATPAAMLRSLGRWIGFDRELRVYAIDAGAVGERARSACLNCNCLEDLLLFQPGETWQSRDAFLSAALYRVEHGERVYTVVMDGRLVHYGWLVPRQAESLLEEVDQRLTLPAHSATLYDFYTWPEYRGRGLYRASLDHMLNEALADGGTRQVFIAASADNQASRRVIEKAGFGYRGSLYWSRRFGRDTKRRDAALIELEASDAQA